MTTHKINIRAHAAFVAVAGVLLAMQAGCTGPASADPEAATAKNEAPFIHVDAASAIDAGRYLVKIGGCNDCHTPGYVEQLMMTGKQMPESDWLQGSDIGFSGAWGVSYPANLRLSIQNMDEEQFLELARAGQGRPPMPWPSLQAMSDSDLKAIYAYIKSLGPKGAAVPAALSPGVAPDRPHIAFVPQMPSPPKS
jgi:mono/diheme cytochrome c family protein